MAENNEKKIQRLHRELLKAEKILGEKVIDEILRLMCEWNEEKNHLGFLEKEQAIRGGAVGRYFPEKDGQ